MTRARAVMQTNGVENCRLPIADFGLGGQEERLVSNCRNLTRKRYAV